MRQEQKGFGECRVDMVIEGAVGSPHWAGSSGKVDGYSWTSLGQLKGLGR